MLQTLINIEEELKLMTELEISYEQLTFLKLLHADLESSFIKNSKYIYTYYAHCLKESLDLEFIKELYDRGYINVHPNKLKKGDIELTDISLSAELKDKIWIESHEAGFELLKLYPESIDIDGKSYSLRSFSQNRINIFEIYAKSIGFSKNMHERIMKETQMAKDNNVLKMSFQKFIYSQPWTFPDWYASKDNGTFASFSAHDIL